MQNPPGMFGQRDELIVGAVAFQVDLDTHIGGQRGQDGVDRRDGRRIADEQESGAKIFGDFESC